MNLIKKIFLISLIFFSNISIAFSAEKIVFTDIDYLLNNSNFGKILFKEFQTKKLLTFSKGHRLVLGLVVNEDN